MTHWNNRCYGAASAKERLDVAIRDAINAGDIPGPRSLANGKEMARHDGDLESSITAFADSPEEMRDVIKHHSGIGVDNIKLVMSGEEVSLLITFCSHGKLICFKICEVRSAQDCYFSDEDTSTCVDEAHKAGKSICAHARARDSVKMCVKVSRFLPVDPSHSPSAARLTPIFSTGWTSSTMARTSTKKAWTCSNKLRPNTS